MAVHSCGINFADILMCMGKYQEKPELPFVPGKINDIRKKLPFLLFVEFVQKDSSESSV